MADEPVTTGAPAGAPAAPAASPAPAAAAAPSAAAPTAITPAPAAAAPTAAAPAATPVPGSPEAKAAADKAAAEAKSAAREAAIKAGVLEQAPEKYEFKMPEGVQADTKLLGGFEPLAKELGLSQASAQKLVDHYASAVLPRMIEAQAEALNAADKQWQSDVKADKEIGGDKLNENILVAQNTLKKFGSDALVKLLNDTRLGNHPEMIRFFHKVGRAMAEDTLGGSGGADAGSKDAAEILYGKPAQ